MICFLLIKKKKKRKKKRKSKKMEITGHLGTFILRRMQKLMGFFGPRTPGPRFFFFSIETSG